MNTTTTTAAEMASSQCPFTFEDGSTRIIVSYKNNRVVGSVSPHALALASPVWKKFIFPPFHQTSEKESSIQGCSMAKKLKPVEELDFSDDPTEALLILLQISHFQFTTVPSKLPLNTLSDVAILCDQYDCVQLVKPWLFQWLEGEHSDWKQSPTLGREKWLFIAWVFGRERVLTDLGLVLVREIQTFSNGNCLALASRCGPMPVGLIESILGLRRAAMEKLLEIPGKCIDRFTKDLNVLCLRGEQVCDAITYGSLLRGLDIIKINPKMELNGLHLGLKYLAKKLSAYEIYGNHIECFATDIKKEVTNILAGIGDPVLDSHRHHIAIQRAKLDGRM